MWLDTTALMLKTSTYNYCFFSFTLVESAIIIQISIFDRKKEKGKGYNFNNATNAVVHNFFPDRGKNFL